MMHILLIFFFFFFNDTATTEIYTLSLHDALPILFGVSLGPADQQKDSKKTFQYYDSITWIRGQHGFKFGGEYIKRPNSIFFLPRHGGEYEYSNLDVFFKDIKPTDFNHLGIGDPIQPLASHAWGAFA